LLTSRSAARACIADAPVPLRGPRRPGRPKDYDEWREVPARLPDAPGSIWKSGGIPSNCPPTKPWLQVPDLLPAKANDDKSFIATSKLDFAMLPDPMRLSSTIWARSTGAIWRSSTCTGLLTIQNFSTCGLLGAQLAGKGYGRLRCGRALHPFVHVSHAHCRESLESTFASTYATTMNSHALGAFWAKGKLGRPVWRQCQAALTIQIHAQRIWADWCPCPERFGCKRAEPKMLYGEGLRHPVFPLFPREFTASEGATTGKAKQERYWLAQN